MGLIVKKGTIGHVSESTHSIGQNGNMSTSHTWAFRIENMPARLKSHVQASISDGDVVTAVGKMKRGTLEIQALRNDTTGETVGASATFTLIMGVLFTILGLPLSFFIVGIVPLFFGLLMIRGAYIVSKAKKMLKTA